MTCSFSGVRLADDGDSRPADMFGGGARNAIHGTFGIDLAREADFELGDASIRPRTREVLVGGERERIEPQVMKVLVLLHRGRGEVTSRDELIAWCWKGRIVGDDAINRCLAKVRRVTARLEGVSIETIPRVGYRLDLLPAPETRGLQAAAAAPTPSGSTLILALILLIFLAMPRGSESRFGPAPSKLQAGEELQALGQVRHRSLIRPRRRLDRHGNALAGSA